MNVNELAANASELFVLPEAVTRIKECMDDHSASIDDIADIIAHDPGLTAQLLKVANSALYRFPNKVETISKALQVIGTRAAYDLALAYGVSHAFNDISAKVIDLDKYWEQSVSCGLLSKYLAEQKGQRESERYFVSGLLHNVGELVMVASHPEQARRCAAYNKQVTPSELQRAILGFTYAELSARLLMHWQIPQSIYRPVGRLHDVADSEQDTDTDILKLAYVLALDNVNADIYPSYHNLKEAYHESLNFSREDLEDALDITNLQCVSVISLFNPNSFMLY
ncbi:HDOD domain-containing protein [Alteromonas aestuariivivens]|uniref:HDOD domain-containing protein n=1 Tax=Alteromonas aestuariivivens TaxID=1938339 RepID=A0A3D8MB24_9ALTE|nr:HDOD domain-containing protein [Alteromonas aestuariivivens]RDV27472.1 HDOD domain-containing protein [Alteromonas aestuariivivens]